MFLPVSSFPDMLGVFIFSNMVESLGFTVFETRKTLRSSCRFPLATPRGPVSAQQVESTLELRCTSTFLA
eukprot:2145688-Lingulodinium_polyedra.AAC.1